MTRLDDLKAGQKINLCVGNGLLNVFTAMVTELHQEEIYATITGISDVEFCGIQIGVRVDSCVMLSSAEVIIDHRDVKGIWTTNGKVTLEINHLKKV